MFAPMNWVQKRTGGSSSDSGPMRLGQHGFLHILEARDVMALLAVRLLELVASVITHMESKRAANTP